MEFKPYWKINREYKEKILNLFGDNPNLVLSIRDVAEKIGCSIDCAKNVLLELTAEKKIEAFKFRRMWAFHSLSLSIDTLENPKEESKEKDVREIRAEEAV